MNLLVVDDREENRLILSQKLQAHGYTSVLANNGIDALHELRRQRFAAVITDLLMPEMDGYQLTHAIKSDDALRDTPVIIYTSTYTDPKDEALARNLGANAFVIKPAEDEQFFRVLAQTLARAQRGELPGTPRSQDEVSYLKDYTARLIHKLEDKVEEAAEANRKLTELNASLETRIGAATAELRDANAELEAYVYSVSHDLRSPLRTIQGMSSTVLEDDPPLDADEKRHLLNRIARNAAQMQRLIDDLLAYSRLKSADVNLSAVPLDAAVRVALERLEHEIDESKARIHLAQPLPAVQAFEPALVQAVSNLVSNAIKFVPPGTIPEVNLAARQRDSWVRLSVSDNGIGIPADAQARIFRAFERLHSASVYPGTGVGLAIVQRAVSRMGGRIGLESAENSGSTFWIELPAADGVPAGTPSPVAHG